MDTTATAELDAWRKTWSILIAGYKRRGQTLTSRHLPQELATCDAEIGRLEREIYLAREAAI